MITQLTPRPGRNEPCRCGSGRKYKQCCLADDDKKAADVRMKSESQTEAQPSEEPKPAAPARAPKPATAQPWKTGSSARGFVPRSRTPRKVGGG